MNDAYLETMRKLLEIEEDKKTFEETLRDTMRKEIAEWKKTQPPILHTQPKFSGLDLFQAPNSNGDELPAIRMNMHSWQSQHQQMPPAPSVPRNEFKVRPVTSVSAVVSWENMILNEKIEYQLQRFTLQARTRYKSEDRMSFEMPWRLIRDGSNSLNMKGLLSVEQGSHRTELMLMSATDPVYVAFFGGVKKILHQTFAAQLIFEQVCNPNEVRGLLDA